MFIFVHVGIKKVAESFGVSKILFNFASDMKAIYVITGISRLTGTRQEISRAMTKEQAEERLARELHARKYIKHPAHTHLRVEQKNPIQLTLKFE